MLFKPDDNENLKIYIFVYLFLYKRRRIVTFLFILYQNLLNLLLNEWVSDSYFRNIDVNKQYLVLIQECYDVQNGEFVLYFVSFIKWP